MSLTSEKCNEYESLKPKPGSSSSSSSSSPMMFEERKNWVWWTRLYVATLTPALQMWKSHVLEWTISDFLTDCVLQNSGLNKIVLVVEITGFWNIIMLLLAQWLCLARICMSFESDYMQYNAMLLVQYYLTGLFSCKDYFCGFWVNYMHMCCLCQYQDFCHAKIRMGFEYICSSPSL
jgi:hypothetical protein